MRTAVSQPKPAEKITRQLEFYKQLAQDPSAFIAAANVNQFKGIPSANLFEIIRNSSGTDLKTLVVANMNFLKLLSWEHLDEIVHELHKDKDMLQRLLFLLEIHGESFLPNLLKNYLQKMTVDNATFQKSPFMTIKPYFDTINNFIAKMVMTSGEEKLQALDYSLRFCLFHLITVEFPRIQLPGAYALNQKESDDFVQAQRSSERKAQRAFRVLSEGFQQTQHLKWSTQQIIFLFERLSFEKIATETLLINLKKFRYWIQQYQTLAKSSEDEDKSLMPLARAHPLVFALLPNNEIEKFLTPEQIIAIRNAALVKDMPQVKLLMDEINSKYLDSQTLSVDMQLMIFIMSLKLCHQLALFPQSWHNDMDEVIKRASIIESTLRSEKVKEAVVKKVEQDMMRYLGEQSEEGEYQLRIRIIGIFISFSWGDLAKYTATTWQEKRKEDHSLSFFRLGQFYLELKKPDRIKAQECFACSALQGNESAASALAKHFSSGIDKKDLMKKLLQEKFKEFLDAKPGKENTGTLEMYCNNFIRFGLQDAYAEQFEKHLIESQSMLDQHFARYLVCDDTFLSAVVLDIEAVRKNLQRFIADEVALFENKISKSFEEIIKKLGDPETAKAIDSVKKTTLSLHRLYQLKMKVGLNQANMTKSFSSAWCTGAEKLLTNYIKMILMKQQGVEDCSPNMAMLLSYKDWLMPKELFVNEFEVNMRKILTEHILKILTFEVTRGELAYQQPAILKEAIDKMYQAFALGNAVNQELYSLCDKIVFNPFFSYFEPKNHAIKLANVEFIYEFALLVKKPQNSMSFQEKVNAVTTALRENIFKNRYTMSNDDDHDLDAHCLRVGIRTIGYNDFSHLRLTGLTVKPETHFSAHFDETLFSQSRLQRCVFRNCSLLETVFINALLNGFEDNDGADFSGANASGANFTGAKMTGVNFIGTNLTDIIISEENALMLLLENLQRIDKLKDIDPAEQINFAHDLFSYLFPSIKSKENLSTLKDKLSQLYDDGKLSFLKRKTILETVETEGESNDKEKEVERSVSQAPSLFSFGNLFSTSSATKEPSKKLNKETKGIFNYFIEAIDDKLAISKPSSLKKGR